MGWIRLRKKEIKDGVISYYYQVEKDGEWGILYYDTNVQQFGCEKLAEGDEETWKTMRMHGFTRLLKYARANEYPETDYMAFG